MCFKKCSLDALCRCVHQLYFLVCDFPVGDMDDSFEPFRWQIWTYGRWWDMSDWFQDQSEKQFLEEQDSVKVCHRFVYEGSSNTGIVECINDFDNFTQYNCVTKKTCDIRRVRFVVHVPVQVAPFASVPDGLWTLCWDDDDRLWFGLYEESCSELPTWVSSALPFRVSEDPPPAGQVISWQVQRGEQGEWQHMSEWFHEQTERQFQTRTPCHTFVFDGNTKIGDIQYINNFVDYTQTNCATRVICSIRRISYLVDAPSSQTPIDRPPHGDTWQFFQHDDGSFWFSSLDGTWLCPASHWAVATDSPEPSV